MVLSHAYIEGRANQNIAGLLGLMGDDFRAKPVCAKQARGPMLLVRTNGDDDGL